MRLGLRIKWDESVIGTPDGVNEARTIRRLPEDQRWCAEEVLNIRGVPSNTVPCAGGDHIPIEANGAAAELGGDEHVPAQEREECDARTTVAAPDPKVRRMCVTRAHIREYGATEWCPGCKRVETGRSMPQQRVQDEGQDENGSV